MLEYKFLYIFLLLVRFIYSETISVSDWKEVVNKNDVDKSKEYIFEISKAITIDTDPGNFLDKYEKITIKGKDSSKRITIKVSDISSVFRFSSENKLVFKLEKIEINSSAIPLIEMQGSNVDIEIKDCTFKSSNSIIQAVSVNSVKITGCEFKDGKKESQKPQIYIENKNMHDRTLVTIENTKGSGNTNDIKEVTSSGGWGYFSNSEIHFTKINSDNNSSDNVGAVFNIRNCTGDIRDSTFTNSKFQGKGVIYQYYSQINIYDTTFSNNKGNGGGIFYVYGTNSDVDANYPPSNLYRCSFISNSGDDTQRAGALNLDGAQVVNIYDSEFKDIHVFSKGGCFQVNYYSKIRVENSRFQSIYALDSGGIFNSGYDSRVEVNNCYFYDIYAGTGAIINSNSGNSILFENSVIDNSKSTAALFQMVEYNTKTKLEFRNVTITDSTAQSGLLYLYKNSYENSDVELIVENCKFIKNGLKKGSVQFEKHSASANYNAPIINISDVGQSTVTVNNCEFIGNIINPPSNIGGALSLNLSRKKPLVFSNLKFINNTVSSSSGNGGGLYVGALDADDAIIDIKFSNLYFEGNHANGNGGGLYIDNIKPNEFDIFRSFEMKNLTFVNNYAEECGGAMAVQSDIFKDVVFQNFTFKGNYARLGGGAYYSSNLEATPEFLPDPPITDGDSAGFGRFLSSEPSKFEFKGDFNKNLTISSGKELKGYTFELLDAWNNLYVSENIFSNVKTLTFLAIKIIDEEVYLNYGDEQSNHATIRGNTFELFDHGICQLDQFKIYGEPGVYYLVFYIPLSGHDSLIHQNLTARVTITDCMSDITNLYPEPSKEALNFTECVSPTCEGKYKCQNNGRCIRPPQEAIDKNLPYCGCTAGYKGTDCSQKDFYEWKIASSLFNIITIILIIVLIAFGVAIIINRQKPLFSVSYPWLLSACNVFCIMALTSIFFFDDEPNKSMCYVYPLIQYISFICLWGIIMFIFYRSKFIVALPTKSTSASAQISIRQSFFVQSSNNNNALTNQDSQSKLDKSEINKQSNQDLSISLLEQQSRAKEEFIHLVLTIIFTVAYVIFICVWFGVSLYYDSESNYESVEKFNNKGESKLTNGQYVKICRVNFLESVTYVQLFLLLFGVTFTNRKWSLGGYHIDLRHFAFGMANWILCGPFITIITFTMMNDNPSAQLSLYRVSIMLSMTPIIPIIVIPKLLLINDKNVNTDDYSTFAIPFSEKQVSKLTSNNTSEISNSQTGTGAVSSFNQGKGSMVDNFI